MTKVTVSVEIPADAAIVWDDVARLQLHVEWMADAESIEFLSDSRTGVGVVMSVSTRVGFLRTSDIIRVVSWDPPNSIGVVHEGLVTGTGEFRLEPIIGGTRFTWDEDIHMPWFFGGRIGSAASRPILAWIWRRNLARLAERFG